MSCPISIILDQQMTKVHTQAACYINVRPQLLLSQLMESKIATILHRALQSVHVRLQTTSATLQCESPMRVYLQEANHCCFALGTQLCVIALLLRITMLVFRHVARVQMRRIQQVNW